VHSSDIIAFRMHKQQRKIQNTRSASPHDFFVQNVVSIQLISAEKNWKVVKGRIFLNHISHLKRFSGDHVSCQNYHSVLSQVQLFQN
jgi:hypothetical protein